MVDVRHGPPVPREPPPGPQPKPGAGRQPAGTEAAFPREARDRAYCGEDTVEGSGGGPKTGGVHTTLVFIGNASAIHNSGVQIR